MLKQEVLKLLARNTRATMQAGLADHALTINEMLLS